jgi:tRNA(Ile)-lysidine synthase
VRGRVIRPLLDVRRPALRELLVAAGLPWLEDPTNQDRRFARNRIRHDVLPVLAGAVDTDVVPLLVRTARLAREAVDALEQTASAALARLAMGEADALTLPRSALAALPPTVAAEVLRRAAVRLGGRPLLRAWAHRGLRRVLAEAPPRRPLRLGPVSVEVSGDHVRVGVRPATPLASRALTVPGRVELPEIGQAIEARVRPAEGYALTPAPERVAFDAAVLPRTLTVRPRRRGDRFRAFGGGERRLKALFIDAKVPRWERSRRPLVEALGEIVWVAGLRRGAAAPVTAATREIVELGLVPLAEADTRR